MTQRGVEYCDVTAVLAAIAGSNISDPVLKATVTLLIRIMDSNSCSNISQTFEFKTKCMSSVRAVEGLA